MFVDVILMVSDKEYIGIVGECAFIFVYLEGQFAERAVSAELHIFNHSKYEQE